MNDIHNTADLAKRYAETIDIAKAVTETSCPHCEHDEAEGGLLSHCDACCRRITAVIYKLTHQEQTAQ